MTFSEEFLAAILLLAAAAPAQVIVDPARIPARLKDLGQRQGESSIRCEVTPIKPALNFGFRFQSGYIAHVPLNQYPGSGHKLALMTTITPQIGEHKPVYLMNFVALPEVPKTKLSLEIVGHYLLGEGRYRVEWTLVDEKLRACRKDWRIEAELRRGEHAVRVAMAPDTVADLSLRGLPGKRHDPDDARPVRLTVLLHAAPLSPRRTALRGSDKAMLLGTLSSLLNRLPSRSLRLVVFNLDQQKEIFRRDDFTPEALDQVAQAMNELKLGLVDYNVLKKRRGHVDLLANLVNQELAAKEPSDEVIFLGPASRFYDKLPQAALEKSGGAGLKFFYLQLRPYFRSNQNFPDSIDSAVSKLKGKTVIIHTPAEFAKAMELIEHHARK